MSPIVSKRPCRVAVVGGGRCTAQMAKLAHQVGAELARRGCVIITGGLGGVMEAAAEGAKSAGGLTVGILPGFSAQDANSYIDVPIVTGLSHARNVLIARSADAIIAVDGQYGTLSEIALGLNMNIPVVALQSWDIPGVVTVSNAQDAVKRALQILEEQREA